MLKCLCQRINRAALLLALLAGGTAFSGCQSQSSAPSNPAPAPGHAALPAPATGANADDRAAESRAVAAALATPATSAAPKTPATPPTSPAVATPAAPTAPAPDNSQTLILREGDTVHITFSGAHTLDSTQTIRRDGKITLEMVGEIKAAGLTAPELEQALLKAYGDQLVVKEVSVVVQTSVFKVFVTGAVLKPGPIISERVETPLEAVIEAGIDTTKSNLKKIVVIREHDDGKTERFKLNLDDVMKGKPTVPFILKSMDKIYVPEKFAWF
jgi:polysaccharide export outer membrane protein